MTDALLVAWVSALIECRRLGWMLGLGRRWQRGEPLQLLFAGYNGTRNTGADVRVQEMLRQVRHVLGAGNLAPSVMTQNFARTKGYFEGARQVHLPDVYPPFLFRETRQTHGVIACEGSMFKSKFANALTTMMIGSLGLAAAQNKLSVGYGAEAGHMDRLIERACARHCRESLIVTRNPESQALLSALGIRTKLGTDTAWTFEPHPAEFGRQALRRAGWDEKTPVLVICPINPFWWPVRASIFKFLARTLAGAYQSSQYRTVYFHRAGPEVDAKYRHYISAIARAVGAFRERHRVFPILVAMERLDARACAAVAAELAGVPVFTSDDYDMFELVSILRCGALMVSSRYHGIVTAMPGLVASAGVTMDERIRNLMHDRGHGQLLLTVDDPELEPKLLAVLECLREEADAVREAIGRTVVRNLKVMARMGIYLQEAVRQCYPEFPLRTGVLGWRDYVPPLSPTLARLVEAYDTTEAPALETAAGS